MTICVHTFLSRLGGIIQDFREEESSCPQCCCSVSPGCPRATTHIAQYAGEEFLSASPRGIHSSKGAVTDAKSKCLYRWGLSLQWDGGESWKGQFSVRTLKDWDEDSLTGKAKLQAKWNKEFICYSLLADRCSAMPRMKGSIKWNGYMGMQMVQRWMSPPSSSYSQLLLLRTVLWSGISLWPVVSLFPL